MSTNGILNGTDLQVNLVTLIFDFIFKIDALLTFMAPIILSAIMSRVISIDYSDDILFRTISFSANHP